MKLLVMEDEIRLADILSDWFQKKGFEVTVCHDGLSGYEKAQNENFDVILSDVMLPGLEGFQLVRKLREKKIATPVLFLTARVEKYVAFCFHESADCLAEQRNRCEARMAVGRRACAFRDFRRIPGALHR